MYPKNIKQRVQAVAAVLLGGVLSLSAYAEDPTYLAQSNDLESLTVETDYALGLAKYDLDTHTELLGWQVSERWYFGRQDGEDSGLTLVWQSNTNQVSLSKDGVRLTRRLK